MRRPCSRLRKRNFGLAWTSIVRQRKGNERCRSGISLVSLSNLHLRSSDLPAICRMLIHSSAQLPSIRLYLARTFDMPRSQRDGSNSIVPRLAVCDEIFSWRLPLAGTASGVRLTRTLDYWGKSREMICCDSGVRPCINALTLGDPTWNRFLSVDIYSCGCVVIFHDESHLELHGDSAFFSFFSQGEHSAIVEKTPLTGSTGMG